MLNAAGILKAGDFGQFAARIDNVTGYENSAGRDGGAAYLRLVNPSTSDQLDELGHSFLYAYLAQRLNFSDNSAVARGGGVFVAGLQGQLMFEDAEFGWNSAGVGGGLAVDGSSTVGGLVQLLRSSFAKNQAGDTGGGVAVVSQVLL